MRVGVHQPPAEASRRSESAAEDLQPASQQVRVEVLIPGDFYPDQFVAIAPLHCVSNDLFGARRSVANGLPLMRLRRVIHVRVEIPLPFQPLTNIAFPFFQKVWVNGPLLIDGNQFFQLASGKLRSRHSYLYAGPFRDIQFQRNRVLR